MFWAWTLFQVLDRRGFIGYERHLEQRRRRAEPHAQNKVD